MPFALVILGGCVPHLYSSVQDSDPVSWTRPENTWKQCGTPSQSFYDEPYGYEVGERFPDVRVMDQKGDTVSLWQFTGCVTVVDLSTSWCGPCRKLATTVDTLYAKHEAQGFMYATLLSQDDFNNDTDLEDLNDWASNYNVNTTPILAEHQYTWEIMGQSIAFPRVFVLDREMRVVNANVGNTDDLIEGALAGVL
jgi:thiol-disulfide isomerase/thioredoxin